MSKPFRDLDLKNSFLFSAALADEETCQLVLEIIMGQKLPRVKVHAEHAILLNSDFRSVRFDIYADDELFVHYNLEMQNQDNRNIAKRSRYYQAEMDVYSLKPGEDYSDLKPGYVIFICTFDPFGKKRYRYTFEERCLECDLGLGDETKKIILSTKGENEADVTKQLLNFLEYVEDSTDERAARIQDESVNRLHERVTALKRRRELEASYMTFEELLKDEKAAGREEGHEEGRKAGFELKLMEQIRKKLAKGQSAGQIAEDLLEEPSYISELIKKMSEPETDM